MGTLRWRRRWLRRDVGAIVSDDPRFNLAPVPISTRYGPLTFTLHAAWDPHHQAAKKLEALARRLATFSSERYGPHSDAGLLRP